MHEFVAKKGLISQGNAQVSGSLVVTNDITASLISASYIETVDPIDPQQVATKAYVDALNPQGIAYYFRSASADVAGYKQMLDLNTPFSASQTVFTASANSPGLDLVQFISPLVGVTSIAAGTIESHYHAWFTGPGNAALTINRNWYIRSGSTETLIAVGPNTVLNKTVDQSYVSVGTLTSSIAVNPATDRLVVKFTVVTTNGSPTFYFPVEGKTSAGIIIPVPSSNFVLKSGDIMTGNLTVPRVIGTASNADTSSYTFNADSSSVALELSRSDAIDYTFPYWLSGKLTGSSPLSIYGDRYFRINADMSSSDTPPALTINQTDPASFNLVRGWGAINNYLQVAIRNINNGNYASTDFIAEADNANESSSYVDVGIASTGYAAPTYPLIQPLDSYVTNVGGNLLIGTQNSESAIKFTIGDITQDNIKMTIGADGIHASGSLIGSASYATTASNVNPGSTLFVVSGSNGVPAAYLEPYDYSPTTAIYQPPYKAGRIFWDNRYNDWAWFAATGSGATSWRSHLGKEISFTVHNPYGVTLPRLSVVYVGTSSLAGAYYPDVYLAIADGTGEHSSVLGVIRNDIPSGSTGFCMTNGVMHRTNMGTYNVGDKLWLSPTVPGGLTTTKPGQPNEQVLIGYCAEAGTLGSFICRQSTFPPPAQAFAGITSNVVISNPNDGTIVVSTGSVNLYNDPTGVGVITPYGLESKTLTLTTGSTNYVIAEHSASVASYAITTDPAYANGINIVRVATLDIYYKGPGNWDIHEFDVGIVGLALANRLNNKDILLYGYQYQSGLTLYLTGSNGEFGITEGIIWYGPNSHVVPAFDTTTPSELYLFHSTSSYGTSSWHQHIIGGYVSNSYDNGVDIVPCAPNSWSVNFVYRLIGTTDEAAIVLSNQQFASSLEAQNNASTPPNLPSTIRDIGMLVGRFVVQSGSIIPPLIESAFSSTFIPAVVTNHEALLGLQGGGSGGGHWHLGADDYVGTGTGLVVRQNNPTMSNPQFAAATPYHIPYWSVNKTLTLTGSVQVQQGQYVTINSASFPDPTNPEALLVKQLNTASVNVIGAYSNIDSFSQIYNQNFNSGSEASTDIVATANVGSQYANYLDMGVAGSGYASVFWPWAKPLDGYLMMDGGDLWIATLEDFKLRFAFNNTASTNYADKTGFYLSGSLHGTASNALWSDHSVYALSASIVHNSNIDIDMDGNVNSIAKVTAHTLNAADIVIANLSGLSINGSASIDTNGNIIARTITASLSGTASYAKNAGTSSYITFVPQTAVSASWVSASAFITTAQTASYIAGANVVGAVATASYAFTSSYEMEVEISSSWASASLSASHANVADTANAISFVPSAATSASWVSASAYIINSDTASYVLNAVSASYAPNLYPQQYQASASWASASISASYSVSASNAISTSFSTNAGTAYAINFVPVAATSASWVSASVFITTAQTASFVTASNVVGIVTSASFAISASWAPDNDSPNSVSASWASSSISSSYANNAGNAYAINFVPVTATSASWVSASVRITTADTASYFITSSVTSASYAISSSYVPNLYPQVTQVTVASASWVSASVRITTADTASYFITSSVTSASYAISASYVPNLYPQQFLPSASWASSSISSSFATNAGTAYAINFVPVTAASASWVSASAKITTADTASYFITSSVTSASYAISASYVPNLYPQQFLPSASWASASISSSFATNAGNAYAINFIPEVAKSASWVSASVRITTADTASYFITSSVTSASYALSASWAPDNESYPASASWASSSVSSSFATNAGTAYAINFVPVSAVSASWVSASAKITNADTASYLNAQIVSASWASASISASFASIAATANAISFVPVTATSASWVSASAFITTAQTASYVLSSSISGILTVAQAPSASVAVSASYAVTASFAQTASFAFGMPKIKAGIITGSLFGGSPRTASVTFTTAFPNTIYSVVVTGDAARTWTIQQKSASNFTINSNSSTAMAISASVYWQAMSLEEFYS